MADDTATVRRVVTPADTAAVWGEDLPPAASTPFILGLAELACQRLANRGLAPGQITVGARAVIEHLAPSPVGATLVATARLLGREGRKTTFVVEIHDGATLVARVEHVRAEVALD